MNRFRSVLFFLLVLVLFDASACSLKAANSSSSKASSANPASSSSQSATLSLVLTNTTGPTPTGRTTGVDKSSTIAVYYSNSNWTASNAGWDNDECLASETSLLDYDLNQVNRDHQGAYQFVQFPVRSQNQCVPLLPSLLSTNIMKELALSNVYTNIITNGATNRTLLYRITNTNWVTNINAEGELSELWVTWDSTWFYIAVKACFDNTLFGTCLMVYFDRVWDIGVTNFDGSDSRIGNDILNRGTLLWSKGVYFSGFASDLYIGNWYDAAFKKIGGTQICIMTNVTTNSMFQQYAIYNENGYIEMNSNIMETYYNYAQESDPLQRVWTFRFPVSVMTNGVNNLTNMKIKLVVLTCPGGTGANALTYNCIPYNSAGCVSGAKSILNNYFILPFTDSNGNVRGDVRPRYDAQVNFLPGSI
jgi:hypothetical protein